MSPGEIKVPLLARARRRLDKIERQKKRLPKRLDRIERQSLRVRQVERLSKRLLAYEMFVAGATRAEIAAKCGWSQQYIDKLATKDHWEQRRLGILGVDQATAAEVERIIGKFRAKMDQRLEELDKACQDGRVAAILGWLDRAGIPKSGQFEAPHGPRQASIVNDIRVGVQVETSRDRSADTSAPAPAPSIEAIEAEVDRRE